MPSKYDGYWQGRVIEISKLLEQAYESGRSDALDVSAIEPYGDRQSWYGIVDLGRNGIDQAQMAHARSLGRIVLANQLLAPFGLSRFRLAISANHKLSVQLLREPTAKKLPPKTPVRMPSLAQDSSFEMRQSPEFKGVTGELYELLESLPRFRFDTPSNKLPKNGIYFFFEEGEQINVDGKLTDRIVRVGTHRSDNRFRARIRNHYGPKSRVGGNKNCSVFRLHLGGALLRSKNPSDLRLRDWLTHGAPSHAELEEQVSCLLRNNFSFSCIEVEGEKERLTLERGLIALLSKHPAGRPSGAWLGHYAADGKIGRSGLWNTQHVSSGPLSFEELRQLHGLTTSVRHASSGLLGDILVIVPCGQGKIWDKEPHNGPAPARLAYTGAPFKVNKSYAERFATDWVILSAKYGFIWPDFELPGPYNVTFKKKATNPIDATVLRRQVQELGLDGVGTVIGLGGIEYRQAVEAAFAGTGISLHFPFAGLPIGKAMQATKRAIQSGEPLPGISGLSPA